MNDVDGTVLLFNVIGLHRNVLDRPNHICAAVTHCCHVYPITA